MTQPTRCNVTERAQRRSAFLNFPNDISPSQPARIEYVNVRPSLTPIFTYIRIVVVVVVIMEAINVTLVMAAAERNESLCV
jgi:hypothetical protein